jgi:polyketide synthase 5
LATVQANDDRAQDPDSSHSLLVMNNSSHSVLAMNKTPAPIAIIGMACRLPGGIDSPDQLWEALLRGDELVTEIPPDRWDADEYYDPEPGVPGRSVCKWGAFLDDVAGFDPEFFGISEREATAVDPQHRLLLETSWEAMEYAGLTPEAVADSLTGVFVGLTNSDHQLVTADAHALEGRTGTGTSGPISVKCPGGSLTPWASTDPR